jgi:hypothetical protein
MKKLQKIVVLFLVTCLLLSCTSGAKYEPIIDGDTENNRYKEDLSRCQELAQKYKYNRADNYARTGTAAAIGAVVGQIFGGNTRATLSGAAIGAIAGIFSSGIETNEGRKQVVIRCMVGRGYNVLK